MYELCVVGIKFDSSDPLPLQKKSSLGKFIFIIFVKKIGPVVVNISSKYL